MKHLISLLWVTGERLQHLLSGTPGVQLIVLNACESASVVTSHLALDLVYSGFPVVVAMQAEMSQEAAKHFIRAFYSQLQQGQSIEYAVAAGRSEIAAQLRGPSPGVYPCFIPTSDWRKNRGLQGWLTTLGNHCLDGQMLYAALASLSIHLRPLKA